MERHKFQEAEEGFRALLTDLIKSCDTSWHDAKKQLRKDQRWDLLELLDRNKKEEIFNDHVKQLYKKRKEAFYQLLGELPDVSEFFKQAHKWNKS